MVSALAFMIHFQPMKLSSQLKNFKITAQQNSAIKTFELEQDELIKNLEIILQLECSL